MTELQFNKLIKRLFWVLIPTILFNFVVLYGGYRAFSASTGEQIKASIIKNSDQDKQIDGNIKRIEKNIDKINDKADRYEIQAEFNELKIMIGKLGEKMDKHIDYHLENDKRLSKFGQ